ncbi:cytochrome P450 [Aspergillus stella-maris]|uniref:cytochrome P450 n=1 Tax=Aspergillus stella-maris TaxID=1810926 RepID=UPI003CCD0875
MGIADRYLSLGMTEYFFQPSFLIILLCLGLYLWLSQSSKLPLPPGPTPLPLIGNVHQLLRANSMEKLQEMHAKYGPIMTLKVGSRTIIMLGSRDVVRDLFEKRAKNFSSRPRLIIISEYMLRNIAPITMPYNDKWRALHQIEAVALNARVAKAVQPVILSLSRCLLFRLLESKDFELQLQAFSCNIFTTLLYGEDLDSTPEEVAKAISGSVAYFLGALTVQSSLVEMFPFLERVPGLTASAKAKGDAFFNDIIRLHHPKIKAAVNSPMWTLTRVMEHKRQERSDITFDEFLAVPIEAFGAGVGSTPLTLGTIASMLLTHPEEAQKVQTEVDKQVGFARLPESSDEENLPYLQAFIHETLRVMTMSSIGMPHAVSEEDTYMGYRIPKDAIIFPFQWALNQDETTYQDPTKFNPQRWIDDPSLPQPAGFGFGKRVCPGQSFVNHTLLLITACLVWGFELEGTEEFYKLSDGRGSSAFYRPPTKFIRLKCKSPGHRKIIEREWESIDRSPTEMLRNIGSSLGYED